MPLIFLQGLASRRCVEFFVVLRGDFFLYSPWWAGRWWIISKRRKTDTGFLDRAGRVEILKKKKSPKVCIYKHAFV